MVGARVDESARPPAEYPSLNAFFARRLAPDVRAWPSDPRALASPVDGVLTRLGTVEDGRLVQAKGRRYSAAALLASEEAGARFDGGLYATIYLAPRHYHRIHAPVAGRLRSASHAPGALFPVNAAAVAEIPDLLATNRTRRLLDRDRRRADRAGGGRGVQRGAHLDGVRSRLEWRGGGVGDQPPSPAPSAAGSTARHSRSHAARRSWPSTWGRA